MDSGAAGTAVAIALVGFAVIGEDGTELAIRVAKAIVVSVVSGGVAFVFCTPIMAASLPRETNNQRENTNGEKAVRYSAWSNFSYMTRSGPRMLDHSSNFLQLTKLCAISCPNE